ncbi:MAG: SEC-C domain-containing protein [Planctomycetes bacterium]|nr:SEC-C domain-containing protein [Planctomycetota bacterium]
MISLLFAGDRDVLRDAVTSSTVFWSRVREAKAQWTGLGIFALVLAITTALLIIGPEGIGILWLRRELMAIVVSFVGLGTAVYLGWCIYKLMPGRSDRVVLALRSWVRAEVDPIDEAVRALSPEALREKRAELQKRLADGESIDQIRGEAYACVREASRRARDHRQFECQMIGARVIENNNVAEMRTGEGKTIGCYAANFMKVLQALKVHMVTVNDYLVKRDAEFCRPIFEMLGVSVGFITSEIEPWGEGAARRQVEYGYDITYGTNSEFGFDYLRDNMKVSAREQMQGRQDFAVVDEVDSILIDEARTPLIISGAAHDDVRKYSVADGIARSLMNRQDAAVRDFRKRIDEIEANPSPYQKNDPKFKGAVNKFRADPLWLSSDEADLIGFVQYYVVELDRKSAHMTEHGAKAAQAELGQGSFYESRNMNWPHFIDNAIRAHICYTKDKEYVVQDDVVIIVDEFTGRMMHGRQWSDGLHQAVEAKERVTVKQETQTLATITLQNLFKLYKQLAGMTGTAMTEADEFNKIYKLEVIAIPTNKAIRRIDYNDKLYKSVSGKYEAIVEEIHAYSAKGYPADPFSLYDMLREARRFLKQMVGGKAEASEEGVREAAPRETVPDADKKLALVEEALDLFKDGEGDPSKLEEAYLALAGERVGGRPLLVGTVSVESSEKLSNMLTRTYGIEHEVLNAKNHAREAEIVAKAGYQHQSQRGKHKDVVGNVTIATNMAGRGTDIKLGENVAFLGGLHVVGTERHESRRIDNQLRGRCGRQGDPGSTRFFLSFEDDLIKLFMGEWMLAMLNRFALQDGVPIEHKSLTKGIANAQKKVEERNFGIRKNLLEYDEVPDQQRKTFYETRQRVLEGRDLSGYIWEMIDETVAGACERFYDEQFAALCISEWASQHIGVPVDPAKLDTAEIALVKAQVKELTVAEARSSIQRSFGEYVEPSAPKEEWDVRGLIGWAAQYGVSLTQRQALETDPDELCERLIEAAIKKIETVDLTPLEAFCDKSFGRQRLAAWAHDKFGVTISPEELRVAARDEAEKLIRDKMRDAYRKREAEYPVAAVIEYAIARGGSNVNAIYEQICRWANLKFRLDWTYDHFAGKNPQQIFTELRTLNEECLRNGKLDGEIDAAIGAHSGDALRTWARQRFGAVMETSPLDLDGDLRQQLRRCGYEMLRYELTQLERMVVLQTLDQVWKDHMYAMDLLRHGIGLRGYAERDPKIEFKREGTRLFNELMTNIRERVTDLIFKVQVALPPDVSESGDGGGVPAPTPAPRPAAGVHATKADASNLGVTSAAREAEQKRATAAGQPAPAAQDIQLQPVRRDHPKVGRNDPCPCGSGKKYKQCHGKGA